MMPRVLARETCTRLSLALPICCVTRLNREYSGTLVVDLGFGLLPRDRGS